MKPPKEVVSPVLTRTANPFGETYTETRLQLPWMLADSLALRFENPARRIRLHVVPAPSRWTTTLTAHPILQVRRTLKGTILTPEVGTRMEFFLITALRTLTGQDHGDVHFWVENL